MDDTCKSETPDPERACIIRTVLQDISARGPIYQALQRAHAEARGHGCPAVHHRLPPGQHSLLDDYLGKPRLSP